MLRYRVFTQATNSELSYGSRRVGVPASSYSLGAGRREVSLIVEAHGLRAGDLIFIGGQWIHLTSQVDETEVDWEFLPAYEDRSIVFGEDHWGPELVARLQHEASLMERRDEPVEG